MDEPSAFEVILNGITSIISKVPDWVGDTVEAITDSGNEIILFSVLVGFIGTGIGLLRRFFKLHA